MFVKFPRLIKCDGFLCLKIMTENANTRKRKLGEVIKIIKKIYRLQAIADSEMPILDIIHLAPLWVRSFDAAAVPFEQWNELYLKAVSKQADHLSRGEMPPPYTIELLISCAA